MKARKKAVLTASAVIAITLIIILMGLKGCEGSKPEKEAVETEKETVSAETEEPAEEDDDEQQSNDEERDEKDKESSSENVSSGSADKTGTSLDKKTTNKKQDSSTNKKPSGKVDEPSKPTETTKPTMKITEHVSYLSPTDCLYTETYCDANGVSIFVFQNGEKILYDDGYVIGINVVMDEPGVIRVIKVEDLGKEDAEIEEIFVWGGSSGAYYYMEEIMDSYPDGGLFVTSWGNNSIVPGNVNHVANMVKEYDAIIPIDYDLYQKYYE